MTNEDLVRISKKNGKLTNACGIVAKGRGKKQIQIFPYLCQIESQMQVFLICVKKEYKVPFFLCVW